MAATPTIEELLKVIAEERAERQREREEYDKAMAEKDAEIAQQKAIIAEQDKVHHSLENDVKELKDTLSSFDDKLDSVQTDVSNTQNNLDAIMRTTDVISQIQSSKSMYLCFQTINENNCAFIDDVTSKTYMTMPWENKEGEVIGLGFISSNSYINHNGERVDTPENILRISAEELLTKVCEGKEPLCLDNPNGDVSLGDGKSHDRYVMLVPIIGKANQTIGISVIERNTAPFDDKDIQLAQASAKVAATGLYGFQQHYSNTHDHLTALLNRNGLQEYLENEAFPNRNTASLCIGQFDIDKFKRFNDTYGHDVGDKVLRLVSDIIAREVSDKGVAFRQGGEEIVVAVNAPIEEAYKIMDKIRLAVEREGVIEVGDGEKTYVTVSGGIAQYENQFSVNTKEEFVKSVLGDADKPSDDPINTQNAYKKADNALYVAKDTGRNKVYDSDQNYESTPSNTQRYKEYLERNNITLVRQDDGYNIIENANGTRVLAEGLQKEEILGALQDVNERLCDTINDNWLYFQKQNPDIAVPREIANVHNLEQWANLLRSGEYADIFKDWSNFDRTNAEDNLRIVELLAFELDTVDLGRITTMGITASREMDFDKLILMQPQLRNDNKILYPIAIDSNLDKDVINDLSEKLSKRFGENGLDITDADLSLVVDFTKSMELQYVDKKGEVRSTELSKNEIETIENNEKRSTTIARDVDKILNNQLIDFTNVSGANFGVDANVITMHLWASPETTDAAIQRGIENALANENITLKEANEVKSYWLKVQDENTSTAGYPINKLGIRVNLLPDEENGYSADNLKVIAYVNIGNNRHNFSIELTANEKAELIKSIQYPLRREYGQEIISIRNDTEQAKTANERKSKTPIGRD